MAGEGTTKSASPASPATEAGASPPTNTNVLPPEHWAQIQQAQGRVSPDGDSTYDDNASSTASITSSILQYRTIHGRTFNSDQGNAHYWGSNDESQRELMDVTHHILTIGLGNKLYLAPLEKGKVQQAIDIGCGTGIWAIDFADEHPAANVIGTDISPIQPSWVPPNLRFEIEDCTQPWTFMSDFSDYIHIRWLFGSVGNWDALIAEAFRVSKPGGWVESHEASAFVSSDDNSVPETSAMGQWGKLFIEGCKKIGTSSTVVEDGLQKKAFEAAGFINIHEYEFRNPIGSWPTDPVEKEMGPYTQFGLETDVEGFILFMAHTMGWTREEIQVYIAQFRRELHYGKQHGFFQQKVIWGQKPPVAAE